MDTSFSETLRELEKQLVEESNDISTKRQHLKRLQQELEVSLKHAEVNTKSQVAVLSSIAYYENKIQDLEAILPEKRKQIEEQYEHKIQALMNERDIKLRKLESTEIPYLKQQLSITQAKLNSGPVLTNRKDIERKMKFEEEQRAYEFESRMFGKKRTLVQLAIAYSDALKKKTLFEQTRKEKEKSVLGSTIQRNDKFQDEMNQWWDKHEDECRAVDKACTEAKKAVYALQEELGVPLL